MQTRFIFTRWCEMTMLSAIVLDVRNASFKGTFLVMNDQRWWGSRKVPRKWSRSTQIRLIRCSNHFLAFVLLLLGMKMVPASHPNGAGSFLYFLRLRRHFRSNSSVMRGWCNSKFFFSPPLTLDTLRSNKNEALGESHHQFAPISTVL